MGSATNSQDIDNVIVFGSINTFKYTNWKGETSMWTVIPHCIRFGTTEYHRTDNDPSVHPDEQLGGIWLLECYDCDKQALRTYALKDIHPR